MFKQIAEGHTTQLGKNLAAVPAVCPQHVLLVVILSNVTG